MQAFPSIFSDTRSRTAMPGDWLIFKVGKCAFRVVKLHEKIVSESIIDKIPSWFAQKTDRGRKNNKNYGMKRCQVSKLIFKPNLLLWNRASKTLILL